MSKIDFSNNNYLNLGLILFAKPYFLISAVFILINFTTVADNRHTTKIVNGDNNVRTK